MGMNTVIHGKDTSGNPEHIEVTSGAAHVADIGRAMQIHNRLITGVTAASPGGIGHATWAEAEGVYAVRFKVTGGAAGDVMKVVFDASPVGDITDDTQAATWLTTATSDPDGDVQYYEITQGVAGADMWSDWFQFSSPLRRADFLGTTAGPHTIFMEVR